MSIELGRLLIAAGVVLPAEVEAALFVSVLRGISFPRALVDRGVITERALDEALDRRGSLALRQVIGSRELFARLPRALCRRLATVPLRHDPMTGAVDAAAADPLDPHIPAELGFHLGVPVRVLRASISTVEEAIRLLELDDRQPVARVRHRRVTPAFPHGAPQSTIPPPPSDDVPIPLVRRAPQVPVIEDEVEEEIPLPARAPAPPHPNGPAAPPAEEEPVLPLRVTKPEPSINADQDSAIEERSAHRRDPVSARTALATLRQTSGAGHPAGAWTEPGRSAGQGDADESRGASYNRAYRGTAEPPAVSFPSSPPEDAGISFGADPPRPPLVPALDDGAPGERSVPDTLRHGRLVLDAGDVADDQEAPPGPDAAPAETAAAPPEPLRPTFADLAEVHAALDAALRRDDIIRVALGGLRLIARRAAVFVVKRGAFHGFACNPEFGDEEELQRVAIAMTQPSILATAAATSVYLGPIPGTLAHAALLDVMGNPSLDVAAVAVRVTGRPVAVLVADDLDDTLRGTRSMDELSRAAGEAFTRILATRA